MFNKHIQYKNREYTLKEFELCQILKSNYFCFYNMWIYPRSHSARKTIRALLPLVLFWFPETAISL